MVSQYTGLETEVNNDENVNFNRNRLDADGNAIDIKDPPEGQKYMTLQLEGIKNVAADERVCRICLSEEEENNPIISPCKCIGSVRYIHLLCIQEWLESKKHKKETPFVNSYIWRGLECEICKAQYKDIITIPKTGQ